LVPVRRLLGGRGVSRARRGGVALLAVVAAVLGAVLSGCAGGASTAPGGGNDQLTLVLPWYADPEGGGFFAAQTQGLYRDNKLDVTLQPGGPQVSATQLVATGRAQVGFTDAAGIVQARAQGIPVIAIGALYQNNPVGVMVHADTGIKSFAQMAGMTWVVQAGQLGPAWIQKTTGVSFQTQQYQGSIANFLNNDRLVQQGWPTNEAYQAQQAGVPVTFIPFSSSGFNPYNDVFFTSESYLASHHDQLQRFLAASMQGWRDYLGDISVARAANQALPLVGLRRPQPDARALDGAGRLAFMGQHGREHRYPQFPPPVQAPLACCRICQSWCCNPSCSQGGTWRICRRISCA